MSNPPEVMNLKQTCEFLNAGYPAVRNLVRRPAIPFRRFGRTFRFSRSALMKWLEAGK